MKLKDIGNIVAGGTPSTNILEYWNGDINWITPKDLSNFNKRFISSGERKITKLGLENSSAIILPKNTILFTSRAPIGYIAIASGEVCTNQGFKSIICDEEKCHYLYMYYWLLNNVEKIKEKSNGSTFQEISGNSMKNIEIDLPSIKIQRKIGKILDTIDEKIELNNEINSNLLALIKTKFKTNFNNINTKKEKLSYFIDSTIGGDWGKEKLEGNYNTEVYCIRGTDISDMVLGSRGKAPTRFILEKNYNSKKLEANNIIIEISGGSPTQSTGRTAYISKELIDRFDKPIVCTNFCRAISFRKKIYAPFIYTYFLNLYEAGKFFNYENGTTGIKNLALNDLVNFEEIDLPSDELLNEYYNFFNSILKKIVGNANQNDTLIQLKNTLLPKLMNDEIDLDNIEI